MNYWMKNHLNEAASGYDAASGNEDIIERLGEIDIFNEKTKEIKKMKTTDFIKVCNDAVYKMMRDYPYLYQFMAKCKIMYIPVWPSDICDTMCVDNLNNLWISLHYVYNTCKMDSNRVFGILFHEMFHIFFEHLLRFNEMYPADMFKGGLEGARKKANMKANICMDYEVNASMVDDGIVDPGFFKRMNCLYKKEYTGMTWEEIMAKVGDKEYKEWLSRNGFSLDDIELKLLDAIEKASKVLMDPSATDEEKRYARHELQKTIDDLLGKEEKGEKSIQDVLDDISNSKLGDIGDLKMDMDDVIDDLYKNPSGMSDDELRKTMNDIDKMMDDMMENAEEIGSQFGKDSDAVSEDVDKARKSLKEAIDKMKKGGLSKEEKEDLIDKAKDDLEDIISDEMEKDKLAEKRKERDEKKAAERKERLKKKHPLRTIIIVLKNFAGLKEFGVVSDKTVEIAERGMSVLDPLTEKYFKDMTEKDWEEPIKVFEELKESFFPDLTALIDNEVILNKTEDDMHRLLDGVFDFVFRAFDTAQNPELDEDAKGSVIKTAAQKLRIIGKILKTQKVWKASDEFKEAYISEMKRLMKLRKEGGDEALFKELWEKGVLNPMMLDDNGMKLLHKLSGEGEIPDVKEVKIRRYSDDLEDIEPYDGELYYNLWVDEDSNTILELSDLKDGLRDSDFEKFGVRFEKDFPEYVLSEMMESVFWVGSVDTFKSADIDELRDKLESNSNYKPGEWPTEE